MSESQNPEVLTSPHVGRHVVLWLNAVSTSSLTELEASGDEGSVAQVMKLWVRLSLLQTRRRPEIAISSLLKHVLPAIGERPLSSITRLQLNRLFNILIADGKKKRRGGCLRCASSSLPGPKCRAILNTPPQCDEKT